MHIEVQVALNFVISYLYNKLPRRRVNIFGEELEKALKQKFHGHWYPQTPFKGSAFRCLKTGEPIDVVFEIAARESGVPIGDIIENLPAELSVWVDPGEVSYRIGEKGAVKILYSEQKHDSPDDNNADREVTTTFNPEAQCFRPIEILSSSLNGMTLSPKGSPNDSSPISSTSPMYKNVNNSPNGGVMSNNTNTPAAAPFIGRQEPVLFTTATFAQTKFGSTKLKNNSKRTNRMSPTEFSNYIKQRQQMQQHNNHYQPNHHQNIFGAIGSVSPSRSISPNPMANLQQQSMTSDSSMHQNPFVFPSNGFNLNMYQSFGSPRGMFDGLSGGNNGGSGNYNQFNGSNDPLLFTPGGKCSSFMDQQSNYCKIPNQQQQQANSQSNMPASSPQASSNLIGNTSNGNGAIGTSTTSNQQQQQSDSKLLDGINFYNNNANSSYQHHLLVAN